MNKIILKSIITLLCMCIYVNAYSQNTASESQQFPTPTFKLYKTQNLWTFIELNTITGEMWQIQFDIKDNNRGAVVLNSQNLSIGKEKLKGRFTLYPTENMYTFILLDQIDGDSWQVQWSIEAENRFVIPLFDM
jgi:hypothetical protein